MHSRTHYAQKTTPARLPLTPRCVLWTALLFVGACGQPETSSQPANPAAGASPGLADRLTARGAEVQADGDGHITLLNLYWTDLTDDDLPLLGGLHQLRTLILPARATTAGLRHLKGLSALAELYPPNEITDEGLAGLAHLPNLKELFLYGSKITDAGLVHFKPLQHLEFLGIQHTQVTGSGLIHLQGLANSGLARPFLHPDRRPGAEAASETLPAQSRGSLRHPGFPGRHPQDPGRPAPLHGALPLRRFL